ncbi:MAG: esterase-like activity of phytase family protein [Desulfarculaceae bacterium]
MAAAVCVCGCIKEPPHPAPQQPSQSITIEAMAVPLNPEDRSERQVGALLYRGGLRLRCGAPGFGGFSGLLISPQGKNLLAVSDRGYWLSARLNHLAGGELAGLSHARLGRLQDPAGRFLSTRNMRDAESLALSPAGDVVVAFEGRHRLWLYPAAVEPLGQRPSPITLPAWLESAPFNQGVEALTYLKDGRLLAMAEDHGNQGYTQGAVRDQIWRRLQYKTSHGFKPTAADALPGGGVLVLERRYRFPGQWSARLTVLAQNQVYAGAKMDPQVLATLEPPLTLDNFEGLAVCSGPQDRTLIYLISDDNYSGLQDTLLLEFELKTSRLPSP